MNNVEAKIKWAKLYYRIGWTVIPINKYKIPTIKTWKEYQNAQMPFDLLEKEIREKDAELAVVCGVKSNVTVLDDDGLKKMGFESDLIKSVNSSVVSRTPSGGHHYYFLGNKEISNKVNISGKAVDIRGEGGYVGVPPSVGFLKDKEGNFTNKLGQYRWEKLPDRKGLSGLKDLMLSNEVRSSLEQTKVKGLNYADFVYLALGERNNALFKLARSLFNKHTKAEVVSVINAINNGYAPPLPQSDVDKLISQAEKYYVNDKSKNGVKSPRSVDEVSIQRSIEYDLIDVAPSTGYPKLDSLIGGFIPGNLYTLTAETNVGKTTLACNFAVNIFNQKKSVLYIALESGTAITQTLASVYYKKPYKEITKSVLKNFNIGIDLFIDNDIATVQELKETIKNQTKHYDLIIVDHIGYFVHDKANYIQDQANILKELRFLCKEKNTAILIVAHLRKRERGVKKDYRPTADDIAGSASFKQDSTDVMIIIREKDDFDEHQIAFTDHGYLYVVKTKGISTGVVDLKFNDINPEMKNALIEGVNGV